MRTFEFEYIVHSIKLDMRHFIWMFILFFLVMFIVFVRINTIKLGYEISKIEQKIEKNELTMQKLIEEKAMLTDTKRLYEAGLMLGLSLPEIEKTYYVK